MKSLYAFIKKELLEQIRSSRLTILGVLFALFGVMNPAVAKLTPWLLDMMADTLSESGMIVSEVKISALDSWVQFYKNIPMALIAFVLIESSIFTKEYSTGTLVLSLTKGLERYKIVLAKTLILVVFWTVGYWLCFGITYVYNTYYWDNAIAHNLMFSVLCWWVFGMMVVALVVLFSALSTSNTGVLCGTGGVVLTFYLIGLLPKYGKYLPTFLTDGNSLIYGGRNPDDYVFALVSAIVITAVGIILSIPVFNKKQL